METNSAHCSFRPFFYLNILENLSFLFIGLSARIEFNISHHALIKLVCLYDKINEKKVRHHGDMI